LRPGITLLRAVLAVVLVVCLWTAATAKAAAGEYLMVHSRAMDLDIPQSSSLTGGPHAVYLLDAFHAGETISSWVTAGNAIALRGIYS
jgi:hypothetical protein